MIQVKYPHVNRQVQNAVADTSKKTIINENINILWDTNSKNFTIMNISLEKNPACSSDSKLISVIKLTNELFLTLGDDNSFATWNVQGDKLSTFNGHKNKILALEVFEYKNSIEIFSISKDESIILWNIDGREVYRIDSKIESLNKLHFYSGEFQLLNGDLIAYSLHTGKKIAVFKSQQKFIENNKLLKNDNRLTYDGSIKLWDSNGDKIKDINLSFSFSKVVETDDNKLIILTKDSKIVILNEKGEIESEYSPEKKIIDSFKTFIKGRSSLERMKIKSSKIEQFPHRFNPFTYNIDETESKIDDQNLRKSFEADENTKIVWDFFNRPIFSSIKNLLKEEEEETTLYKNIFNTSIDEINEKIDSLNKKIPDLESSAKTMVMFAVISAVIGIGVGAAVSPLGFGLLVFGVMFFMNSSGKNGEISSIKNQIKNLENQIKTINIVYPEMNKFMDDIRKYRHSLFVQIPVVKNKNLYSGKEVQNIMQNLLDTKINKEAMEYCGLVEDDIIHIDKKPIILNDGSFLQSNTDKLNHHNVRSFWFTSDGSVLFAVQYIQFIYLTSDKIDIFSAHYDFIQNKFIRKEAQAFYYKDVTNISKKEVERDSLFKISSSDSNGESKTPATEISLKVTSQDTVSFTIFNKDTLKDLNENTKVKDNEDNNENINNQKEIEELKKQCEEIRNSDDLEEDEKELELEYYMGLINELESTTSDNSSEVKFADDFVNKAIQNIRSQIKKYK